MADRVLSTSRRTLLGAAASLPVLALAPPVIARSAATRQSSAGPDAGLDCFATLAMTWDRRLARYRRLAAEAEEAAAGGWLAAAYDRYDRELAEIAARFGSPEAAADSEEDRRQRRAAFERVDAAEEAYWDRCTEPMQQAAVALALTPAPDLSASAAKLAVMRAHQLHELSSMTRDCYEVLEEDIDHMRTLASTKFVQNFAHG